MHTRDLPDLGAIDADHARVLALLRAAGERPLPLAALDHAGVRKPATVVYELESRGYLIRHVGGRETGLRLDGVAEDVACTAEGLITAEPPGRRARDRTHARDSFVGPPDVRRRLPGRHG